MRLRLPHALPVIVLAAASGLFYAACGGDDNGGGGPGPMDAGRDVTNPVDAGNDVTTTDSGHDSSTDAGRDGASDASDAAAPVVPNHVFFIMMENNGTQHILQDAPDADPYIVGLSQTSGLATNYYGVTHPSESNYLAAISGDFFGQFDDQLPQTMDPPEEFVPGAGDGTDVDGGPYLSPDELDAAVHAPHWYDAATIVDGIEGSGRTWRAYMESMVAGQPSNEPSVPVNYKDAGLDAGNTAKLYRVKHNPFMYFSRIAGDVDGGPNPRLANIVPYDNFATDIAADSGVPNFVWITPNMCNDMHSVNGYNPEAGVPVECDGTNLWTGPNGSAVTMPGLLQLGDAFVKKTVEAIKASPAWRDKSAIVIVWDEDEYLSNAGVWHSPTNGTAGGTQGGGKIVAMVLTSYSNKATTFSLDGNHYTLLATIQKLWGLPCTANSCGVDDAGLLMTPLFQP